MSRLNDIIKKAFGDGGEAFTEKAMDVVKENGNDILKAAVPILAIAGSTIALLKDGKVQYKPVIDPVTQMAVKHFNDISIKEYTHIIFD